MNYGTLISVVMPVFNRAHLVPRVVGSICAQSYHNLEIVIVDDCSSDGIEDAVAALKDPRVRLLRREQNGGAAAARNTGVAAARGDWIAFHDSDDICTRDRIELSVRKMASLPEDYIGLYGLRIMYHQVDEAQYGAIKSYVRPLAHERPLSGDLALRTVQSNILNLPTLLVKKSALIAAGPFDEVLRQNEDWDLSLRLTRQGKFGFVTEPLILTPTSLDPHISAQRVSRSARQGARSYARITGKLKRQGFGGPGLAQHYATTARYLMEIEHPVFARRYLKAALKLDPWQPKVWAHLGMSHAPGLHARLRRPLKT